MEKCEYVQDECETIELTIYEQYIRQIIEDDWEEWVNSVGWTD